VVAAQELAYTLTFRNEGAAAGAVDKVDDLTHVLDDGDIIVEPTASDEALTVTRDGARISIAGTLQAGQEVTVTYTVQVRASADRGDDVLANFLLLPDAPTPETPGECEAGSEDCTFNPVGDIVPAKSVNPSTGTTVAAGSELTYTLSFENVGSGAAVVDYTDYMDGVLDDAELVGTAQATDGLTVSGPADGQLHVTGTLESGRSATVTYTVLVKAYDQQGDHELANFLTPAGQEPPTECLATNPLCTQNPIDPPAPGLAVTGGEIAAWVLISGLTLLIGGGALMMIRRRREQTVDAE
jgi:LPXTG-motif cell wall-anchored protein